MDAGLDTYELPLRHYLNVLWRQKMIVVATVVMIVALGGIYTYSQTPVYQSTAKVLLQPSVAEVIFSPDTGASGDTGSDKTRLQTEIEVMRSQSVQEAVEERLGEVPAVHIAQLGETEVVTITAMSPTPEGAARSAQTYAETYLTVRREQLTASLLGAIDEVQAQIDVIREQLAGLDRPIAELDAGVGAAASEADRIALQEQRDELIRQMNKQRTSLENRELSYGGWLDELRLASNISRTGGGQLLTEAEVPASPLSPKPMQNFVVALGLGVLLSVVMAFLREHYDDAIKEKEDLEQLTGDLPVLGLIPSVAGWKKREAAVLVSVTAPNSPPAEAYRTLRTSLQFVGLERPVRMVQVTSPNQGESKTTTVCNLAVVLAQAGHRVILVDCDLRQPRLHQFFGLGNEVGLASALVGSVSLADTVRLIAGEPRLAVMPSGPLPPNPSELLSSGRCGQILALLDAEADFILLDGPPVLPFTDALVLAGLVDAVIMVVTANTTTRHNADRAIELLEQVDAPLIGSVLNRYGSS